MRRTLPAALAIALLSFPQAVPASGGRRFSVRVADGRRVEVFRAIPLYRGLSHELEVRGQGVDRATRVEAGRGLSVSEPGIRRSTDSLGLTIQVAAGAPLGSADLRLRYPSEPDGPEVFPVVVLRNGRVTSVAPRRVEPGQKVTLTFAGTEIGNAEVLAHNAYAGARVLPAGTETRCQVELTFRRPGTFEVPLYDRAGLPRPGQTLDSPGGYVRDGAALVEVSAP